MQRIGSWFFLALIALVGAIAMPAASFGLPPTSNLVGRYVAGTGCWKDDGVTPCASGDRVYRWDDQSGGNNNLYQTTTANQPYYVVDHWGNPTVVFPTYDTNKTAITPYMVIPATISLALQSNTFWYVGSIFSTASQNIVADSPNTHGLLRIIGNPSQPNKIYANSTSSGLQAICNYQLIGSCGSASNVVFYNEWTSVTISGAPTQVTSTGGFFMRGAFGAVKEFLVYNATQGSTDRTAAKSDLVTRYNLPTTRRTKRIVCVGDSRTYGHEVGLLRAWPIQLYEQICDSYGDVYEVIDEGVNGSTAASCKTRWDACSKNFVDTALTTNIVTVKLATNDLSTETAAQFYTDLCALTNDIHGTTGTPQVFVFTEGDIANTTLEAKNVAARLLIMDSAHGGSGNGIMTDGGATLVMDWAADIAGQSGAIQTQTQYYQSNADNHESTAGCTRIAKLALPYFCASGVNVSGPAAGVNGSASNAFTVSFPSAGSFTGSQSVTITPPDGTVMATCAGATITGNGTGAVTVKGRRWHDLVYVHDHTRKRRIEGPGVQQ